MCIYVHMFFVLGELGSSPPFVVLRLPDVPCRRTHCCSAIPNPCAYRPQSDSHPFLRARLRRSILPTQLFQPLDETPLLSPSSPLIFIHPHPPTLSSASSSSLSTIKPIWDRSLSENSFNEVIIPYIDFTIRYCYPLLLLIFTRDTRPANDPVNCKSGIRHMVNFLYQ